MVLSQFCFAEWAQLVQGLNQRMIAWVHVTVNLCRRLVFMRFCFRTAARCINSPIWVPRVPTIPCLSDTFRRAKENPSGSHRPSNYGLQAVLSFPQADEALDKLPHGFRRLNDAHVPLAEDIGIEG